MGHQLVNSKDVFVRGMPPTIPFRDGWRCPIRSEACQAFIVHIIVERDVLRRRVLMIDKVNPEGIAVVHPTGGDAILDEEVSDGLEVHVRNMSRGNMQAGDGECRSRLGYEGSSGILLIILFNGLPVSPREGEECGDETAKVHVPPFG
jgi:hypothetical protein